MEGENLVLYRKYRPKNFDEILGQEHVVRAVTNAIKMGKVAHAYLFSGPRGTGKTTIARLIAKALQCDGENKPCNKCSFCEEFNFGRPMDLIEIDAASNRGIDEVRELRDAVRFAPSRGKYKIYIIDEVHMMTKDAFNALLKTLEEPPAHAVFILATTELEKVLPTIISRTQHYDFKRPTASLIASRLKKLAEKENFTLDDDASRMIALAAEGSFRDGESILGQILISLDDKRITKEIVEKILGLPRREAAKELFSHLASRDTVSSLKLIQRLSDDGYDLNYFNKLMVSFFRNGLFLKTDKSFKVFLAEEIPMEECEHIESNLANFSENDLVRGLNLFHEYSQRFKRSPLPQLPLELAVIEFINSKIAEV